MKKSIIVIIVLLVVVAAGFFAWKCFGQATGFTTKNKYLIIYSQKATKQEVLNSLLKDSIITNPSFFILLANRLHYWDAIKPGRYKIENGQSAYSIIQTLKSGVQESVKWVIVKLRTPENLAAVIGKKFECDSAKAYHFLTDLEKLKKFGVDTQNLMTAVIPNTYVIKWNTSPEKIFERLWIEQQKFWNTNNRKELATKLGYTPQQIYTIASIVEEETNKKEDKGNIASVYFNRLKLGMSLDADPTIKYALRNFKLKRIYFKDLEVVSPYNTYKNKGLPPGPICTPSIETIDAVLNAPTTDYLYFVARSDFSGFSDFASNFEQHKKYAQAYQKALDTLMAKKKLEDSIKNVLNGNKKASLL